MDSPYDVLGIDADADDATIVAAYRERVKETHPDHGGSPREFQRVMEAYGRLRAGYDAEDVADERENGHARQSGDARENGHADENGHARESGRADDPDDPPEATVEYLNYEVLEDHGWRLDDDDLFEKAAAAGLDTVDHGRIRVRPGESLLEAAEQHGLAWPFACRGGACANCAVAVLAGDLAMPVNHVLPPEMMDRHIRLSCNGVPTVAELKVVYNVKHLPDLDELRLPPHPFKQAYPNG